MSRIKRVLMVSSEAVPFAKSGGLADVVTSLSAALLENGTDVRILMPYYSFANVEAAEDLQIEVTVPLGISQESGRLYRTWLPRKRVPVYLLANSHFYEREGIYGGRD
ncbi:MAG TPA: glycogen/starch synthase, partial [Spirochaetia bacterium]|nr:glycogen/starch synthase [Spirochaetia bacterium]